eukprot:3846700-Pyramimonas_sp.AAC.1
MSVWPPGSWTPSSTCMHWGLIDCVSRLVCHRRSGQAWRSPRGRSQWSRLPLTCVVLPAWGSACIFTDTSVD